MKRVIHYKKNLYKISVLFSILFSCTSLQAQAPSEIKTFSIGDTVPEIVFHHMLNYKESTARLSNFQGKLVILDFWNTWCESCIEAFPKMDSLQKHFKNEIQIILVNTGSLKYDGKKRVLKTLANVRERTGFYPDLPISILDTVLNQYFPHNSVPHEIWIGPQGKVVAITGANQVTASNIHSLLSGRAPGLEVKNSLDFERMKPVWQQGRGINDNGYQYRSVFTSYIKDLGIHQGIRYNDQRKVIGVYMTNLSLISFVRGAYYKLLDSASQRMIFEVKDPNSFQNEIKSSYYCYDLLIPPVQSDSFHLSDYLKEDLKRAFHISAKLEKRNMKCWVVFGTTGKIKESYSKYHKRDGDMRKATIHKYLHHWPVSSVVRHFGNHLDHPLLDETGLNRYIDIDFPAHFTWPEDPQKVLQLLKDIGFRIKLANRNLNVLVITDQ